MAFVPKPLSCNRRNGTHPTIFSLSLAQGLVQRAMQTRFSSFPSLAPLFQIEFSVSIGSLLILMPAFFRFLLLLPSIPTHNGNC